MPHEPSDSDQEQVLGGVPRRAVVVGAAWTIPIAATAVAVRFDFFWTIFSGTGSTAGDDIGVEAPTLQRA